MSYILSTQSEKSEIFFNFFVLIELLNVPLLIIKSLLLLWLI